MEASTYSIEEKANGVFCSSLIVSGKRLRNLSSILEGTLLAILASAQLSYAQSVDLSTSEAEADFDLIRCAVANIFQLIEGPFGALVMVVSGLGAIISAAMGAYRAAVGMLVVAVGSFILRSLVSLFFGNDYSICSFD